MIDRPRLQTVLARRFEVPLTIITAAAGSGKSSLVRLAVDDNRLDPRGRDVVIGLRPRDADRTSLLSRLAMALGVATPIADDPGSQLDAIADAVWGAAPDDVVVWLDDAHLLDDDAWSAIGELIEELPTNGHLALVSREPVGLGLARRRAHGELIELGERDLRLDDDETDRLVASIGGAALADGAPRHAATAALLAATGSASAGIAFLQEEVIAGLDPARADRLRRLVALERIDAGLARELTDDDDVDLDELLRDLPLVSIVDGHAQLHDLLRDALVATMSEAEIRKVRSLTGDALARRHDHLGAIDAHLAAGDQVSARSVAERYVSRPTVTHTVNETNGILRRIGAIDHETPLIAALRATALQSGDRWREELDAWRHARELSAGTDTTIEALALHRVAQTTFLDIDPWASIDAEVLTAYDRLEDLSDRVPLAAAAAAHIRSQSAHRRSDAAAALDALDDYRYFEPPDDRLMRWQRLTDLGLVEQVGRDLTADDWAEMPKGGDVFLGYAMWLRGEGPPELGEAAVAAMIDAFGDRGQRVGVASAIGTGVPIALACGLVETAADRLARLRTLDQIGLPRTVRMFLAVGDALVAAVRESDEAGGERFRSYGQFVQVCGWPLRPHLLALSFIYLTQPDSRPALDAMTTGPAMTTAIAAGRSLVALRERGDTEPANRLVWSARNVLRNNVLPHHLAELACAADLEGHREARALLHELPDVEHQLRRVAEQGAPVAATRAEELLGDLPRVEPAPIGLRLLGRPTLERDGADDESIAHRARAAELLAHLALRGESTRDDVIDAIWGGHDSDDKASASLRSALAQLQRLLEPDRERDVAPHHLRTSGQLLSLHGVHTDVDEFERLHRLARQADTAGTPRVALGHYVDAMERYGGDLLAEHDSAWVVLDRVRLRSLAAGAATRIAELVAARGDAEDATAWARRALRLEPLSDRAAVVFVRSLIANDDRSNAAIALRELLVERRHADIDVSPALRRLAEQLPDIG